MTKTDYRTVAKIKRLLVKGIAQGTIASKAGVSPATVSRISLRMEAEKGEPEPEMPVTLSIDDEYLEIAPYRCKGCGEKVNVTPCMICWALEPRKVR